jgi:hypothetical protein
MTCASSGTLTICGPGPWRLTRGQCLWCGKETRQLVAPVHGGWCGFDHQCGECGIYWTDDDGVDMRSIWEDSESGRDRKRRIARVEAWDGPEESFSDILRKTLDSTGQ